MWSGVMGAMVALVGRDGGGGRTGREARQGREGGGCGCGCEGPRGGAAREWRGRGGGCGIDAGCLVGAGCVSTAGALLLLFSLLLLVSWCLGGVIDDVVGGAAAYVGCRGWKKDRMDGCTSVGVLARWSIAFDCAEHIRQ